MVTIEYTGVVVTCADGVRRLQVDNLSYPGQTFSCEDLEILFKMFPDSPMKITFDIEIPDEPLTPREGQ